MIYRVKMELGLTNLDNLTGILQISSENSSTFRFFLMICTFTCILVIFNCFKNLLKAFVIHEAVPKINQKRFINAVWHVIFSTVVLMNTININITWDANFSLKDTLKHAAFMPQCNNNIIVQTVKQQKIFDDFGTVVLPITFFLHQLYASTSLFLEPDVLSTVCCSLFIYASHTLRCPNLCLRVLSLLALDVGSMELARAIYALKSRKRGFKGPKVPLLLRIISVPSFFLHVICWSVVNLYLVPILFLSLPAVSEIDASYRFATAYVNIFLVLLAKQRLFESPVWYLFKMLVTRPADFKRMRSFQTLPVVLLLPYTSQLLPELKAIQMDSLLNAIPTRQGVKVLKRKMRYRYEQKNGNEPGEFEREDSANDKTEMTTDPDNDITDIYVPVPHTSQHKEIATCSNLEVAADVHELNEDTDIEPKESASGEIESGNDRTENPTGPENTTYLNNSVPDTIPSEDIATSSNFEVSNVQDKKEEMNMEPKEHIEDEP
ncbi:hypothetical protein FOCC_FOCC015518 [Frankliniella occidentalis]|nr:hypothetical protein FOCC_FOCC015518 [Frankliniella occidentalis]